MKKVNRIVRSIRAGRYKRETKETPDANRVYLMWGADDRVVDGSAGRTNGPVHIAAPKIPPPGHAGSYNPPPEYLFNEEEKRSWLTVDPRRR